MATILRCIICDKNPPNWNSFAKHLLKHHFCYECIAEFSSKQLYTVHCAVKHGGDRNLCSLEVTNRLSNYLELSTDSNAESFTNRENFHIFLANLWPKFVNLLVSNRLSWKNNGILVITNACSNSSVQTDMEDSKQSIDFTFGNLHKNVEKHCKRLSYDSGFAGASDVQRCEIVRNYLDNGADSDCEIASVVIKTNTAPTVTIADEVPPAVPLPCLNSVVASVDDSSANLHNAVIVEMSSTEASNSVGLADKIVGPFEDALEKKSAKREMDSLDEIVASLASGESSGVATCLAPRICPDCGSHRENVPDSLSTNEIVVKSLKVEKKEEGVEVANNVVTSSTAAAVDLISSSATSNDVASHLVSHESRDVCLNDFENLPTVVLSRLPENFQNRNASVASSATICDVRRSQRHLANTRYVSDAASANATKNLCKNRNNSDASSAALLLRRRRANIADFRDAIATKTLCKNGNSSGESSANSVRMRSLRLPVNIRQIKSNVRIRQSKSNQCRLCSWKFITLSSKRRHVMKKHLSDILGVDWLYKCLLCENCATVYKGRFRCHMAKWHKNVSPQFHKGVDYVEADSTGEKLERAYSMCFQ